EQPVIKLIESFIGW
ncbi:hypothetical protein CISIN_1g0475402mg, partial [Citrus sinensis]